MLKEGESMDKIAKFLEIPIHLIQTWAKEEWQSMMSLFDQERAVEQFGYEKRQEGREEGRIRQAKKTAVNMRKRGSSLDEIAEILELPADTIRTWVKEADALTEENPQILIKITDLTLISSGGSNYYKTFFRGRGG